MFEKDNIDIPLQQPDSSKYFGIREAAIRLKQLRLWLDRCDIKYSLVYTPTCNYYPASINLRKEDAVIFRLVHDL